MAPLPCLGRRLPCAGGGLGGLGSKVDGRICESFPLEAGSVLVMGPGCQEHYKHGAPNPLKLVSGELGYRINITFRQQHEPCVSEAPGDPFAQMVLESDEAVFQRMSLVKEASNYKDACLYNQRMWHRYTKHLCKDRRCNDKWCCCGARAPQNVPLLILDAYCNDIERTSNLDLSV